MKCRQKSGCDADAAYRFTWPGSDESHLCEEHAMKLRAVANAMGCYVQMIELPRPDAAPAAEPEAGNG